MGLTKHTYLTEVEVPRLVYTELDGINYTCFIINVWDYNSEFFKFGNLAKLNDKYYTIHGVEWLNQEEYIVRVDSAMYDLEANSIIEIYTPANLAKSNYSLAVGLGTIASGQEGQFVQGCYNKEDTDGYYLHIVGNGTETKPSNAYTLSKDGSAVFAGTVSDKDGDLRQTIKDYADSTYATKSDLNNKADSNHMQPISHGGTGGSTSSEAMQNLGVARYVVETGTSSRWSYEKYNDHTYKAWINIEAESSASATTKEGGVYTSDYKQVSAPTFSKSITYYNTNCSFTTHHSWDSSWVPYGSNTLVIMLISPNSVTSGEWRFVAELHGTY